MTVAGDNPVHREAPRTLRRILRVHSCKPRRASNTLVRLRPFKCVCQNRFNRKERGWPHSFSGTRPPKNPASDFHRTRLAHSIKRRANAGLAKLHKSFANIASLIHSVSGTRTLNRRLPVSLKLPSIESRTRACDSCTTRKSAPFRVRAKFEPLCKPLQLAVRFLRILLPAPPTALLAVCLPSDDALWGWR
jgi:hypothetical protein